MSETAQNAIPGVERKAGLILVVGDWVIDEYWLLVRHHSRISSHVGFMQFRMANEPTAEILDLCGAGHVARVLHDLNGAIKGFDIIGLGNWNAQDTELIGHLLHARNNSACKANSPGFRIARNFCDNPPNVQLHSLAPEGPTIRVVRQYHRQHTGIEQLNRVDWEERDIGASQRGLDSLDLPSASGYKRVVIIVNDLRKKAVTSDLISDLLTNYPDAVWCVRSKVIQPDWLTLVESRLRLLVVGPEVAEQLSPWASWVTHNTITQKALNILSELPGDNVALISGKREVVARVKSTNDCIIGRSQSELSALSDLGFPTAVFALLCTAICARQKANLQDSDLENAIEGAEDLAGILPLKEIDPPYIEKPSVSSLKWGAEEEAWRASRQGLGLITRNGKPYLDVWRGASSLPGYVTCVKRKAEIVSELGRALSAFKQGLSRHNPLSMLIRADPGAGKTLLAKRLADAFNFQFLPFDITQMMHRSDLLELFDDVATRQANSADDLLVFVDEINATLDGSPAYGAFLAPLEEGHYLRRGNRFSLKPCAWMFVGTLSSKGSYIEKSSDFESRMTLVRNIDSESLREAYRNNSADFEVEARLEQVYLGVTMIHRFFPDVTRVSRAVLEQFYNLPTNEAPARRIRRLCTSLKDVQYGRVDHKNCEDWKDIDWNGEEEEFVTLHF